MINAAYERTVDVAAVAAVASPWWLPHITLASETATLFLPILGCGWLILQMWVRWRNHK